MTLNNGVAMPVLAFGVFQSPPAETTAAVETALADGYRLIDTAASYENEREVGAAIRASGIDRAQQPLRDFHARYGIATEAWSPLGGIQRYRPADPNAVLNALAHPTVTSIADKHGKTPAQVVLRWHIEHAVVAIPKSVKPHRIAENIAVFDFELTAGEVAAIDALDTGVRGGPDPETLDLTTYPKTVEN